MVAVPGAETAVANPFTPGISPTVTDGSDEVHVANIVRFCTLLSESVPVAANCWLVPRAIQGGFVGVTMIVAT